MRPNHYGEALTEDDVNERLKSSKQKGIRQEITEQKSEASEEDRRQKQLSGMRASYGDDDDDTKEFWVGCDTSGCKGCGTTIGVLLWLTCQKRMKHFFALTARESTYSPGFNISELPQMRCGRMRTVASSMCRN